MNLRKKNTLDKEQFIEQYAIAFMASYAASIYVDCCMNGDHSRLYEPQIEDAYHMAEKVWENKEKLK